MKTKSAALSVIVVIVALLGFCIENIFTAFSYGVINNKNMMLPFLLGYGLAILALYALFGTPDAPMFFKRKISFKNKFTSVIYYFIISFLSVCIAEIVLGYITEWFCNIIWWNYTDIPMHITRYTSVPTSAAFALLITVFMTFFFNPLLRLLLKIKAPALNLIAVSFLFFLGIDFIHSAIYMLQENELLHVWKINLESSLRDIIVSKIR